MKLKHPRTDTASAEFTRDELTFAIQALSAINLNGRPADLQAALALLNSIVAKLNRAYKSLPPPAPTPPAQPTNAPTT